MEEDGPAPSEEPVVDAPPARRSAGTPVRASAAWAAKRAELFAARQRIYDHQHSSDTAAQPAQASSNSEVFGAGSADQLEGHADSASKPVPRAPGESSSAAKPVVMTFSVAEVKRLGFGAIRDHKAKDAAADDARVEATQTAPLRLAFQAARKQVAGGNSRMSTRVTAPSARPPLQQPLDVSPSHHSRAVAKPRALNHVVASTASRPRTAEPLMTRGRTQSSGASVSQATSGASAAPMVTRARRASTTCAVAAAASRDDDPSTRMNFDKRTCRRTHAGEFTAAIALWRRHNTASPPQGDEATVAHNASSSRRHTGAPCVRICIRKRPLCDGDTSRGEYDAVTIPQSGGPAAVVHVCSMRPDLRRMFLRNITFRVAAGDGCCFGENATDEEVFLSACQPLVRTSLDGYPSALFLFGQTGSGKTHTMRAFHRRAAEQLLPSEGGTLSAVAVSMFEIAGKTARDLLAPVSEDANAGLIALRDAPSGGSGVELIGATVRCVSTAAQLLDVIADGTRRRATRKTAMNADSSRSHAVLRLQLVSRDGSSAGSLTLVDCAGSERKEDSFSHDATQRKEGAHINASLYALKECMRARAKAAKLPDGAQHHVHVPYRSSVLTRVLAECLTSPHAALCVVGTVSPAASDAEHSMSTLQAVSLLAAGDIAGHVTFNEAAQDIAPGLTMDDVLNGGPLSYPGTLSPEEMAMQRFRALPPVQWKPTDLATWLRCTHGGAFARVATSCPRWMAGRDVARMSCAAVTATLCGGDAKLGAKLHDAIRDAIARASAAKAKA